ncbi:MAG: pantetheine-phosphate adenylyltransferase [Acidobacteria bacterium]|nr:pantetheine-phosphate adenylyltransferase [Acidobacteriota bacterium]MCB9396839.1 pantetheine-phosphate adenylyltransferase [Acidobacteriota bacterium]
MKRVAVYAFSGDPITFGHIHIIERAVRAFDEVIVAIGRNPAKKYLFSLEERVDMAKKALVHLPQVRVDMFTGLLVDYAQEQGAGFIIKGVRNNTDFDYENALFGVGESQKAGVDTLIFMARPNLAHISSSVVKAIQLEHGFIHDYVPLPVKQALERKISGQVLVGISGEVGAGKSFIGQKFKQLGDKKGVTVWPFELDAIALGILERYTEPYYVKVRQDLVEAFGPEIASEDGFVNRKALGNVVFQNAEQLRKLNRILEKPVLLRLKKELQGKRGLILLNSALLMEADLAPLSNNCMILVKVDKKTQKDRLKERGLNSLQLKHRLESQLRYDLKSQLLDERIQTDGFGIRWDFDNSEPVQEAELEHLFDQICADMKCEGL